MMDIHATSLYPSAMYDEKCVYPKTESEFAFKLYMINVHVEVFNFESFNENGNESAILENKFYNPHEFTFDHFPVKEKINSIDVKKDVKWLNYRYFN